MFRKKYSGIASVIIFCLFTGCANAPDLLTSPIEGADQATHAKGMFLDDLGCFPVDCDLPPGMHELCLAYQTGNINWPANCLDFRDQACQALCEREKANLPVSLPMTTVDGFQVGWMQPIQVDDHIRDATRTEFGWMVGFPIVDAQDNVLVYYDDHYRYWDGNSLDDPKKWEAPSSGSYAVIDNNNIYHIIATEKMGAITNLIHITWDGIDFTKTILFPSQFSEPLVTVSGLDIDDTGNLHLTFQDRSMGFVEVWYAYFNKNFWAQPVRLSQSPINSFAPSVAAGKDGAVFVAWHEEFQEPSAGQTAQVIIRHKTEKGWGEPVVSPMTATFIEIQTDQHGFVYVFGENQFVIWDGILWEGPYEIDYPENATAFYHRSVEDNGQIHFLWNRYHEVVDQKTAGIYYEREVCYRKRSPEGAWGPVISLGVWSTAPTYAEFHSFVDIDSRGIVHTVFGGNVDGLLRLYYTNSGAAVEQPGLLTGEVHQPGLVGLAAIKPPTKEVNAKTDPKWNTAPIFEPEQREPQIKVAVDASRNIHAVWQSWDGEKFNIIYSQFDGSQWSRTTNLSQFEGQDVSPVIAVDSLNRVHVAWVRYAQGTSSIYWTFRDGGAWSEPQKLSKKISWKPPEKFSAMVDVEGNAENATKPSIAAGPNGRLAISLSHDPENWGFTGCVAIINFDGNSWSQEVIPGGSESWALYADWSNVDLDGEGNTQLVFVSSGMMDEGSYLFSQPIHMVEEKGIWSDNQPLLPIPPDTNPYAQMVFRPFIHAADNSKLLAVFSMRLFDRDAFPYRLDIENSNAYIIVWNGESWGEPRRLDETDAYGPSYADIDLDATNTAHLVWAKYDAYNQRYALYYTTSDGNQEGEIVEVWKSELGLDPLPILKPDIVVDDGGRVHIIFSAQKKGLWETYHLSKP